MGLAENLAALAAERQASATKRRKYTSDLVRLISSIPDPEPTPVVESAPASGGGGGQHTMDDGHGHGSASEVKGLNSEFSKQLNALVKASGGKISIGSGYRSIAEQTKIYNDWKAGRHPAPRVAKPGRSNHNFGLAADLKFSDREAREFAHRNAGKYGLVFPMGDEPWHVEPVNAKAKRRK